MSEDIPFEREARTTFRNNYKPSAPEGLEEMFVRQYAAVRQILNEGQDHEHAYEVGFNLTNWAGEILSNIQDSDPEVDCKKGCFYCCFVNVKMSIPEAIYLCTWLRNEKSDEQIADILRDARSKHATTGEMSSEERHDHRERCPLLGEIKQSMFHDGRALCTAYEARPLQCRQWHSYDVDGCEQDYNDPESHSTVPVNQQVRSLSDAASDALGKALNEMSLPHSTTTLEHALCVVLEDPKQAANRWLDGEDIFAD